MNEITIFTLNGCHYCQDLKKKLINESIKYNEIEITQQEDLWDRIVEKTGHDILPTIYVQNVDINTGTVYIPGINFNSIEEIVLILKKYTQ
jgi:glutaredoxin